MTGVLLLSVGCSTALSCLLFLNPFWSGSRSASVCAPAARVRCFRSAVVAALEAAVAVVTAAAGVAVAGDEVAVLSFTALFRASHVAVHELARFWPQWGPSGLLCCAPLALVR